MKYEIRDKNGTTSLFFHGKFTFQDSVVVDDILLSVFQFKNPQIIIDLKGLEYLDSFGLGGLLTLREQAEFKNIQVSLANPVGGVKKILELSHFDLLFEIR